MELSVDVTEIADTPQSYYCRLPVNSEGHAIWDRVTLT